MSFSTSHATLELLAHALKAALKRSAAAEDSAATGRERRSLGTSGLGTPEHPPRGILALSARALVRSAWRHKIQSLAWSSASATMRCAQPPARRLPA